MAFRFSLSVVLRHRQLLEQQALFEVEMAQAEISRLRFQLIDLELLRGNQESERAAALSKGLIAVKMTFAAEHALATQRQIEELQKLIQAAEAKRTVQLGLYQEALKNREVLDQIRVDQHASYLKEVSRREQQRLDEISQRKRNSFE